MILSYEWTGADSATSAITFYALKNLTIQSLKILSVDYDISNDGLNASWRDSTSGIEAPTRTVYAPLYLDAIERRYRIQKDTALARRIRGR